jgi:hypothetical protein
VFVSDVSSAVAVAKLAWASVLSPGFTGVLPGATLPAGCAVATLIWLKDGVRLREKGGKVADVPMPYELLTILRAAVESDAMPCTPGDYVIPNRRSASVRRSERTNKIVYETVVKVAERAGVKSDGSRASKGVRCGLPYLSPRRYRVAPSADESLPR